MLMLHDPIRSLLIAITTSLEEARKFLSIRDKASQRQVVQGQMAYFHWLHGIKKIIFDKSNRLGLRVLIGEQFVRELEVCYRKPYCACASELNSPYRPDRPCGI